MEGAEGSGQDKSHYWKEVGALKVVILCGGKGTRLREETEHIPKPLVPIGGMPIIWHIMNIYAAQGHNDFILCLGYKGIKIKEWFYNYQLFTSDLSIKFGKNPRVSFLKSKQLHDVGPIDWRVTMVDTGLESMTGHRIKRIEEYVKGEDFLLTYGDGVSDVDVNKSIKQHKESKSIVTLTGVRPPGRFGEIVISNGVVETFYEKPQASSGLINGGFFVLSNDVFDFLGDEEELIFEKEPLSHLARNGLLGCYEHSGFWQPMDNFHEYQLLNSMWNNGNAPWKIW